MKKPRLKIVLSQIEPGTFKAVADVTLSAHLLGAITIKGLRVIQQNGRAPRVVLPMALYRIREREWKHRPTVVLSPILAKHIIRNMLKFLSNL